MKKGILIILTHLFILTIFAQEDNCPEPKKKAVKLFEEAKLSFSKRYGLLIEATKIDPNYLEAYNELADINGKKANNARSAQSQTQHNNRMLEYLKKIIEICPEYRGYYASMTMGDYYFFRKEYSKAKPYYQTILSSSTSYKEDIEKVKKRIKKIDTYNHLINNPVDFNPQKIEGPSTGKDEYLPMLSPDNRFLFFTRRMPDENKDAFNSGEHEVFIKSRKVGNNKFTGGIPMPKPFNLGQFQGGVSISINNKLLFITVVEVIPYPCTDKVDQIIASQEGGYRSGFDNADIYFSEFIDGQWSELKTVGDNISTPCTWESMPSISADNKTLYYARVDNPKMVTRNTDIYKSERQADGSWGDPINLGAPINTPGEEKSPFMHSDSYTLYFSSDEHIGLGGYDIFYSKMDVRTEKFQEPVNIGHPINTEKDEHGFIVSLGGDRGFYNSSEGKNKERNFDIYSFELYEEARPEKVVFVEGRVVDEKGEVPENIQVILKNVETNKEVEGVVDKDGNYVAVIAIKKDEKVILTAKKEGFSFSSQLITPKEITLGKPIETKVLEIKPIEVGKAYTINDINFATNSSKINKETMYVLNGFIDFLTTNSNVKIAIQGHTDNVGDEKENLILSENRAKSVYSYLILEDINPERLSFKGFGESKPIASNKTPDGRAKNRRTEFLITDK